MGYRLVGEVAMVVHFAFLAYLVVGGFVAWRWRRSIWVHLAAAVWGGVTVLTGIACPLTAVEDWGRSKAGQEGLPPTGFIDRYVEGVIYPEQYTNVARLAVAVVVLVSWMGYVHRNRGRIRNIRALGGSPTDKSRQ
jgi:Protein of Unknown function (DUF2784)